MQEAREFAHPARRGRRRGGDARAGLGRQGPDLREDLLDLHLAHDGFTPTSGGFQVAGTSTPASRSRASL